MAERVTLEDIARACGVSPATVSLALRNKPGISRKRRDQIIGIARELGYTRVMGANLVRGGRPLNVVLICRTYAPAHGQSVDAPNLDMFNSWVLTGVQHQAEEHGMALTLANLPVDDNNVSVRRVPDQVLRSVDGILLLGAFSDTTIAEVREQAAGKQTPIVLIDRTTDVPEVDSVSSDNVGGTMRSTEHLIEFGHRDIVFAGRLERTNPNFAERVAGYQSAMHYAGLQDKVLPLDAGERDLEPILQKLIPCTAIVTPNDWDAEWILSILQSASFRIPKDISVVGFDDTEHATSGTVHLTTLGVDKLAMGRYGVQLLLNRLRWPDAARTSVVLEPRLIRRRSVWDMRPVLETITN